MTQRYRTFSEKELQHLAEMADMVEVLLLPTLSTAVGLRFVGQGMGYNVAWLADGKIRECGPVQAVRSAQELAREPLYQPIATAMLEKADLALLLGCKSEVH